MLNFIFSNSDLYADIAHDSYSEYLNLDKTICSFDSSPEADCSFDKMYLLRRREQAAIKAVVFQALAIEAYVNLFGYCVTGEIEIKRADGNYMSTVSKLEEICRRLSKQYPTDSSRRIRKLFSKRDSLVHQKPQEIIITKQPFDYNHPEKNYEDISSFYDTLNELYNNLDNDMQLYNELQENIKVIRNSDTELLDELCQNQVRKAFIEIEQCTKEMFEQKPSHEL